MPSDRTTPDDGPLAKVHTRVIDVIAGYEELVERAEPDLRPLATSMLELHRRHRTELDGLLAGRGHAADDEGSFMSLVQENVIRVRSWVDDMDTDLIPRIRKGEEQLVELYDDAVEASGGRPAERGALEAQRAELRGRIADMAAREAP
jgi:hypothetical protein